MEIKKELKLREIGGDFVLVPVGKTMGEFTGLFPLTESGADIWKILPEVQNAEEIVERLYAIYDVERETLADDVDSFLDKLRSFGII